MISGQTVKLIIIGAGKMGQSHVAAFSGIPGLEIVGIVSKGGNSAESLAQEFGIPYFGIDWRAMALETGANACVVAVAHLESESLCKEIIEFGLHVLAEKPVSINPETLKVIGEMADSKGLVNMAGVNRRFYTTIIQALDTIRFYGDLKGLTVIAPDPVREYMAMGTYSTEVYQQWAVMNTLHIFDIINLALGYPNEIIGRGRFDDLENSWSCILSYPDDILCTVIGNNNSGGMQDWQIIFHGEGMSVQLGPLEKGFLRINGETLPLRNVELKGKFKAGLREQALAFTEAIRNGSGTYYPVSDFRDHAQTIRLVDQMIQSAKNN
ncbi:MAG: Gfo/Idh/MocA family protein [Bacteroidia bacterium]